MEIRIPKLKRPKRSGIKYVPPREPMPLDNIFIPGLHYSHNHSIQLVKLKQIARQITTMPNNQVQRAKMKPLIRNISANGQIIMKHPPATKARLRRIPRAKDRKLRKKKIPLVPLFDHVCKLCNEPAVMVYMPCAHRSTCEKCSQIHNGSCPVCGAGIDMMINMT